MFLVKKVPGGHPLDIPVCCAVTLFSEKTRPDSPHRDSSRICRHAPLLCALRGAYVRLSLINVFWGCKRMRAVFLWLPIAVILACGPIFAETPAVPIQGERISFNGVDYDVVRIDAKSANMQLFWKRPDGEPFHNFLTLANWLKDQKKTLLFATNAGIYARDHTPLGLFVEDSKEYHELNRKRGGGNFFLKPNGVFYIDKTGAHVMETEAFAKTKSTPPLAVQSGPMLLVDGAIHPAFRPESESKYIRNGVGVASKDTAIFAVTKTPVNFHAFACFFRDRLNCSNALYLDGMISGMYAPCLNRPDPGLDYVGILAVVGKETP
jgi:uncharacterized protein YigE (DUF2233 family)